MSDIERELGWNDEIEKDGADYVLLPEGDYDFCVKSFERSRFNGSSKLPPCNMAILSIEIESEEGTAMITHRLYLHTKTEGLLSAFFTSIGEKTKGEKIRMNWAAVPGARGRCKIGIHEWTNDSGEKKQSNDIKKFYAKEQKKFKAGEF